MRECFISLHSQVENLATLKLGFGELVFHQSAVVSSIYLAGRTI